MRLAARFSHDQREIWADLMRTAEAHVAELDRRLAADCRRLGIPENFRPSHRRWLVRPRRNASKERRTELRRVMHTRLVALKRAAVEAIEAGHRQFASAVLTAAIDTEEARKLLAALPTAEQLMPRINYEAISRSLLEGPEAAALRAGRSMTDESGDIGEGLA
jgi:hypothetical protein